MKFRLFISIVLVACFCVVLNAQEKIKIDEKTFVVVPTPWQLQVVDTKASLRGLNVFSKTEVWASGTDGTIINTVNGGKTWRAQVVPGAEELDFRDIHAIDDGTIVVMTSCTPARIYRSTNGGISWNLRYQNTDERVFLDALSFLDDRRGVVMGDSIDGTLFLLLTNDSGKTWKRLADTPATFPGEAGFAASGSNMTVFGNSKLAIALGSAEPDKVEDDSRVLITENVIDWTAGKVPMKRSPSGGIFSINFANAKDGVVVGGDYQKPEDTSDNYAVTRDGGKTWTVPKRRQPPTGFRSCVTTWMDGREVKFIAVGTNGTDLSSDLGNQWRRVSNEGFHAVEFTPDGQHGWACGSDGRVAKWLGIPISKPAQSTPNRTDRRRPRNR